MDLTHISNYVFTVILSLSKEPSVVVTSLTYILVVLRMLDK